MLISRLLWTAQLVTAAAASDRDWLFSGLPQCWQDCFENTGSGCSTSSCICDNSRKNTQYLPSTVKCAVPQCDTTEWILGITIGSVKLFCGATFKPIPDNVMRAAYDAAKDTSSNDPQTTQPPVQPKPSSFAPSSRTGKESQNAASIFSSTFTRTTTNEGGNTLQVIVPIAAGPSGTSTGSIVTSTVDVIVTPVPQQPSSGSPEASSQDAAQGSSPTSSPSPSRAGGRNGGGGSPFDSGAGRWATSTLPLYFSVWIVLQSVV